jgi:steroid 5-alpha reductase family enzyme
LFALGVYINIQSDNILLNLRKPGESGYKIPYGGMFRYVSSPNYLGEIIEWTGYALACWSLPALSFAVWTIANLVPRAIAHHRWYQRQFSDYPAERKALIPFVI